MINYNSEKVDISKPDDVASHGLSAGRLPPGEPGHHAAASSQTPGATAPHGRRPVADPVRRRRTWGRRLGQLSLSGASAPGMDRPADAALDRSLSWSWMTGFSGWMRHATQRTIAAPAAVEGVGYWSGRDVRVEFRPAAPHCGIVFVRGDLPGCPRIPATIAHRVETPAADGAAAAAQAGVDMIEHVMAALAGMQVDNCEVWVNEPEMPGCDGSALPFVAALAAGRHRRAGRARGRCGGSRRVLRLGNEQSWIEARPGTRRPA